MSVDTKQFFATLGAISSDLQESVDKVNQAEKASEPRRQMAVNLIVALLIILAFIVVYNRFMTNSTVTTETTNTEPENDVIGLIKSTGQRLNYQIDALEKAQKFTVLHIAENGNALVVDEDGDVWNMLAGEFIPSNAEPTNLHCDSNAVTLALTMPESVLSNCKEKVNSNSEQFKRDIPTCANGQKLWVTQNNANVQYSCK